MWNQWIRNCIKPTVDACRESKLFALTLLGQFCAFFGAVLFFCMGIPANDYSLMMIGALWVWLGGVCYCLADLKSRILLLSFYAVIFVFLMCRPLIDIARGVTRWHYYAGASVAFAAVSVAVSVLCLHLGAVVAEALFRKDILKFRNHPNSVPAGYDVAVFRTVTLLLYLFCGAFYLYREMDALIFMQGRQYTDYYTAYIPGYPSFVYTISQMMPYALCMYLATLPRKREAFVPLALYVLVAVPQLIIGIRNPIVLNLIFVFLYYCIRDIMGDSKKWLGGFEKACLAIGAPVAAVGLSAYNYLRDGMEVANKGIFSAIEDLFYKQGVSFDVLCMGHNAIPSLPGEGKCYTFGPFIDNFYRGTIGQLLFGAEPFPPGNNAIRAVEGNSFAHSMSYVAHPDYLEGSGWGSSYILETFADWGWPGIIVFSLLLGGFLVWFLRGMRGNWFVRTILLISLTQLLFIPRSEAMGWWSFITGIHFWFVLIAGVISAKILQ